MERIDKSIVIGMFGLGVEESAYAAFWVLEPRYRWRSSCLRIGVGKLR